MALSEEKLAGVDRELEEFGRSDEEISEIRSRFVGSAPQDLVAVDAELSDLADGLAVDTEPQDATTAETGVPESVRAIAEALPAEDWDDESTEVLDIENEDFDLVIDDDLLEEIVEEEEPAVAAESADAGEQADADKSFFKKLFGGRRNSERPQK